MSVEIINKTINVLQNKINKTKNIRVKIKIEKSEQTVQFEWYYGTHVDLWKRSLLK